MQSLRFRIRNRGRCSSECAWRSFHWLQPWVYNEKSILDKRVKTYREHGIRLGRSSRSKIGSEKGIASSTGVDIVGSKSSKSFSFGIPIFNISSHTEKQSRQLTKRK